MAALRQQRTLAVYCAQCGWTGRRVAPGTDKACARCYMYAVRLVMPSGQRRAR